MDNVDFERAQLRYTKRHFNFLYDKFQKFDVFMEFFKHPLFDFTAVCSFVYILDIYATIYSYIY